MGTIAQFFHLVVAEEKKKRRQKTKAFYDWATTGIRVISDPVVEKFWFHTISKMHKGLRGRGVGLEPQPLPWDSSSMEKIKFPTSSKNTLKQEGGGWVVGDS